MLAWFISYGLEQEPATYFGEAKGKQGCVEARTDQCDLCLQLTLSNKP